jgi:hypothetical protein
MLTVSVERKEIGNLRDVDVDERIKLKWWVDSVNWTVLVRSRYLSRSLVDRVTNYRFTQKAGN